MKDRFTGDLSASAGTRDRDSNWESIGNSTSNRGSYRGGIGVYVSTRGIAGAILSIKGNENSVLFSYRIFI